jgi:DNA invertase Pin-like site-specific DNA recombinase
MSEYELNLLRQRGIAARDAKAGRGALRFTLPPGFCWSEDDRIEIDPDERVQAAIRLVFDRFRELGSARQVFLWVRNAGLQLPVVRAVPRHVVYDGLTEGGARSSAYCGARRPGRSPSIFG